MTRELASFAGFGTLRHFYLKLCRFGKIILVTPKRPEATCLIAEYSSRRLVTVANRASSSPPSPQLLLPPIRFIAIASVLCAHPK